MYQNYRKAEFNMKKLLISLTAIALSLLVFTACEPKEEEKPACTHTNTEIIPATQPTICGEYAYRAGKKCLDCGETIVAPVKYGEMKEHIEKNFSGVPVSCTKDGKTPSVECSFCGDVLVPAETIKALGHEYIDAPTIAPTCTEAGYEGGKICKLCGEYDPDNRPTKITEPTGHEWNEGEITTEPTDTEDGVKTYTCTVEGCGETKTEAVVAENTDSSAE